jgi:hypothetical protein
VKAAMQVVTIATKRTNDFTFPPLMNRSRIPAASRKTGPQAGLAR